MDPALTFGKASSVTALLIGTHIDLESLIQGLSVSI